ncbi:hypothetical protein D4764_06G0001350 [Takifugu flavidus]|uniref:Uncharacterized protein n=1 Tax=Takifugu flavidus TaxID=433684 RepID=A0A5C6MUT0_9TELE|nr:hypothetical protein D4764_06G0001350 [Takifugu flavidus]
MLLFLLLSFYLFSPILYLYKNKALLMTVGSQGPAGDRVRMEGQEGLMCCCCTEVWAITMAAATSNTKGQVSGDESSGDSWAKFTSNTRGSNLAVGLLSHALCDSCIPSFSASRALLLYLKMLSHLRPHRYTVTQLRPLLPGRYKTVNSVQKQSGVG